MILLNKPSWKLHLDWPSLFLPMASLSLFPRSEQGEQGWNLVSFTSMLSSNDMWSAVGKSCSWSLGCSSEHSEHRVSCVAKICSSLKLLMSIVLKLCLWKWAVRCCLLTFTKAVYFSFFVRSPQSPLSSNGAPSCNKQWITVGGFIALLWVCVNENYSCCFLFFRGMSSGAK